MIEQLPHDEFAENSIIGICLVEGSETFIRAKQYITKSDIFYTEDNKAIWEAMVSLYESGGRIDEINVCRNLRKKSQLSFAGISWANVTMTKTMPVVSSAHIESWCEAIIDDYVERLSIVSLKSNKKGKKAFQIMQETDKAIKEALNFKNIEDWADMSQMGLELIDRRDRIKAGEQFGVKTGFRDFDNITGGLESGLIVIAARPSMGKTAFAASLAVSMALHGTPGGIISLEMPKIQLASRIISIISGTEFWRIFRNSHRNDNEEAAINRVISDSANIPLYVSDQSKVNLSDIRYKSEKLIKTKGAKYIMIDYLQLMDANDTETQAKTREQQVAAISRGLTRMSKDLNIPVIALAQLNRESENAKGASLPGKLSQLRESDAILSDAAMGIIIDRPFKRGETQDEKGDSTENKGAAIIEKFRNGITTTIDLDFDPETMMFMNQGDLQQVLAKRNPSLKPDSFKINSNIGEAPQIAPPF